MSKQVYESLFKSLAGIFTILISTTIITGTFSNLQADEAIWDISATYYDSFNVPVSISEGSITYEISSLASASIVAKSPTGVVSSVDIENIGSDGFSHSFLMEETGLYQIRETYSLTISSDDLGDSFTFTKTDVQEYYNTGTTVLVFKLDDMYVDNFIYNIIPNDTLSILDISPSIAKLGDICQIEIGIRRPIEAGEIINVAMELTNAKWHKTSSLGLPAFQHYMYEGWSLMSFTVNKCFYQGEAPTDQPDCVELVNISDLGFSSLADWFSSTLIPINPVGPDNAWLMVIGPDGSMDNTLPSEFHSLKYMSPIFGYQVKMNTGGVVMHLDGPIFDANCTIPLKTDWNTIGYPLGIGYYDTNSPPSVNVPIGTFWVQVPPPVAQYVFGSISGKYSQVKSDYGAYVPDLAPEFSSLHYIAPGYGYQIKMLEPADLIYPSE